MDSKIRQYADSSDLTSLKYIFVDALDVDPTFQLYEEDYNYVKSIPGLLEQHVELTPFVSDSSQWTEAYWTQLKLDLKRNFSDRRMNHMREVAQVLLADKVRRLKEERQAAATASRPAPAVVQPTPVSAPVTRSSGQSALEQQILERNKMREAQMRASNAEAAAAQAAQEKRRKERAAELERENQPFQEKHPTHGASSKKAIGIALAVAAAVVVVVLILLLKGSNPE